MTSANTKDRILSAATEIVMRDGVGCLSLDAVAHEAGISKGGLLYHFPAKNDLLSALVRRFIELTDARISGAIADDTEVGAWTRGYLAACATDPAGADPLDRLGAALLATAAGDRSLLEPLHEHQAVWRQELRSDGIDPVTAMIVRLAADGLWMNDLFGLDVLTESDRVAVNTRLREATRS